MPEPLFYKVVGLRPATLLKKRLWHWCFPVNFAKFLRTFFYRTPLGDCFYRVRFKFITFIIYFDIAFTHFVEKMRTQNTENSEK